MARDSSDNGSPDELPGLRPTLGSGALNAEPRVAEWSWDEVGVWPGFWEVPVDWVGLLFSLVSVGEMTP